MSDRGTLFVSAFWQELCRILGIKRNLSTAYHPETGGQSENANKRLETYLRAYVNYHQDDWIDWLPMAEFSDNAKESSSSKVAPFLANYGFLPRMSFDWSPPDEPPTSKPAKEQQQDAARFAQDMDKIWSEVARNLRASQESQAKAANKNRKDVEYQVGDMVYLSTKNIKTHRPPKKEAKTSKNGSRGPAT